MADASRPPPSQDWRDLFAALPLESPPNARWPHLSAALAARAVADAGAARAGRARRRAAGLALAALAASLAALALWMRPPAQSAASSTVATAPGPARIAPTQAHPAQALPVQVARADASPARDEPGTDARASAAAGRPRLASQTPPPRPQRPARPAPGDGGTHAVDAAWPDAAPQIALDTLYAQSARLEAVLRSARDPRVDSGPGAALAGALDSELARIDAVLAQPDLDETRRVALWRARVDALRRSASFEASLRSLSAQGDRYDGTLASVD